MSDENLTGGCLCGSVRYEITAAPLGQGQCHCRDCQYVAGGAPAHVVVCPNGTVNFVKGTPSVYESVADSGAKPIRKFCSTCGTHITSSPGADAPFEVVKVGTLDDASQFAPQTVLWASSAQPWHHVPEGVMRFEKDMG